MKATSSIILNALFLILLAACIKTEDPERVKSFHISGIVVDKATHTPLDSVTISLSYTSWFSPSVPVLNLKTAKDGTFEFTYSLNQDEEYLYYIDAEKIGYNWTNESVDPYKVEQSFEILLSKLERNK
jgi:hypothetical protein